MASQVLQRARRKLRTKNSQEAAARQEADKKQQEVESLLKGVVRPLIDKEVWALQGKMVGGHRIRVDNIGFFAGREDILAVSSRYGHFYVSTGHWTETFRGSDEVPEDTYHCHGVLITEDAPNPDHRPVQISFNPWQGGKKGNSKSRKEFIEALTEQVIRITTYSPRR